MRHAAWGALLACALSATAAAEQLTLDEALASVAAPHPDRRVAESELALARANREEADSRQDFSLFLDGSLRTGRRPDGDWKPDNIGRIVARKPLFDFGRSSQSIAAADQEVTARQEALYNVESLRRIDIMARYFDVLMADRQYAADNEFMAVAYVAWDNAKDRFKVGQISQPALLKLETEYQDVRERRNASEQRMRSARQRLAQAIYRPDTLPEELAEPELKGNARPVPEYEALLPWVMAKNPRILALQAQLAAADARLAAIRADRNPTLDAEVIGGGYSRESTTRDEASAGLVFTIPLYQGGRVDARIARELAQKERIAAELEKLKFDLSDTLLATLQEIEWLRGSSRAAADKQIEYRDWALERARAEYELELKTNLGTSMAETQMAQIRRKQVEYRLALALARLQALSGGNLPPVEGARK
ncbi:TolC family protein [Thiobacillus sp.]|uniref:TolC family protein n=1 Tax=Thiobacillus sp. TaxID=924 RepID=UPI0011D85796|nr:TolC family protein [Thiobacillus sp.]MBC2730670.1 TolC family protein [Thiobacillus sp.]MBC2739407.1 TolC family protein [Thiobacillus sp.]MBC2760309.1 TolC family protein [Thiobacillus sp.]TXH75282.1 MAG: TolC family protein [Thiobacillus sp.]